MTALKAISKYILKLLRIFVHFQGVIKRRIVRYVALFKTEKMGKKTSRAGLSSPEIVAGDRYNLTLPAKNSC